MIFSHRKAHFFMIATLSGLLPLIFLAGLIWRPTIPTVDESADELFAAANFSPREDNVAIASSQEFTVEGVTIDAAIASTQGETVLLLHPLQPLKFSDVLVYWTPTEVEEINDEALLLGSLSGTSRRRLLFPEEVDLQAGYLLFYSRGQNQAIASVVFPAELLP